MCDQTEIDYLDGDVVWVKLGSCWWPGEVVGPDRLPPDVLPSFRKPPIAVVKFFQESTYEYVKNINSIYKYNCSRKNEFINKGLYMYRTKHGHMEKFPEDVIRAETAVGGDIEILTRDEFQEVKKESYAGIFGDNLKRTPNLGRKGRGAKLRPTTESPKLSTPIRKSFKEKSDYKVHILLQGSKETLRQSTETASSPSTSRAGSQPKDEKLHKAEKLTSTDTKPSPSISSPAPAISTPTPAISTPAATISTPTSTISTPTVSSAGIYSCPSCSFSTMRLNVLILHNKTHSATFTPYTPSVRKKAILKSTKSTPNTAKTPKTPRPKKEKIPKKPSKGKKRPAEDKPAEAVTKKPKTDQEIKSSLLADWDDVDEDSNDESTAMIVTRSPEVPMGAESPAVPTPAESSAQVPIDSSSSVKKSEDFCVEKPESSSDSKYEFCEEEDWPVETDAGRKIPRMKNPSKRKDESKSVSIDEDEVAKEVAELLSKTTVPELPSVPESLKAEENFPEPPVVKSPDKKLECSSEINKTSDTIKEVKPTKAIFKTKTFFRSRHSRSQDAIGKYVAEQLNAAERIDLSESDINGSEVVSSPETRESPPIEHVKVARLAPKIQLKKMKAEAAQLREKEKEELISPKLVSKTSGYDSEVQTENVENEVPKSLQDVLYPTQEIKPINKDVPHRLMSKDDGNAELENGLFNKECNIVQEYVNDLGVNKDQSQQMADEVPSKLNNISSEITKVDQINELMNLETCDNSKQTSTPMENINKINEDFYDQTDIVKVSIEAEVQKSPVNTVTEDHQYQQMISNERNDQRKTQPQPKNVPISANKLKELTPDKLCNQLKQITSSMKVQDKNQKIYEQLVEPYMSESTASAVDALLSVSRETDRVPRIISNDPPEDLFEDDKECGTINDLNVDISASNIVSEDCVVPEYEKTQVDEKINEFNEISNKISLVENDDNEKISSENVAQTPSKGNDIISISSDNIVTETVTENMPTESDLQIAETLINLPSSAVANKSTDEHQDISDEQLEEEIIPGSETIIDGDNKIYAFKENDEVKSDIPSEPLITTNNDTLNIRYETEQEKSENLNAAQSLVQMSESIDHKINIPETNEVNKKDLMIKTMKIKHNNGIESNTTIEQKVALLSSENNSDSSTGKSPKFETSSSKLLKILEEPAPAKMPLNKTAPVKQLIISGREKILNFDVAKSPLKAKTQTPKQKIIIRRAATTKNIINNLSDVVTSPDKIILSRSNSVQDGSSIQTFTIQAPQEAISTDSKQIIIQPKLRKITKPSKFQKIKPQNSLITQMSETKKVNETPPVEEPIFDINSMPVVLSDDILTPESIEKMPIVMSDGNIITTSTPNPPKLVKAKSTVIENEKIAISSSTHISKPEVKTLLMNTASDVNKGTTPNILSKSSKLRGAKPMLVIDKATGKQKIIMTKSDSTVKEVKQPQTLLQTVPQNTTKAEKFIILPTGSSPRAGRTQKIVIDPQTGKAHVLVAKGQETPIPIPENKPVSAKLIPSSSDTSTPGNTVMIITNAQGAQSRIVLTPEHEKILFPNKQQQNVSQLKTITHRITTNSGNVQKTVVTAAAPVKTQTRIVPKQKSAIITSKGQLIVGGRVTTTAQNIAPMPEIRPAPKRIIASEPKKLVQTIQKTTSEPLIFLQQKSGSVMQLTAAQFEHLQRTGQIIQKTPPPPVPENKIVVQKSITISPKETVVSSIQKPRIRKTIVESTPPAKKVKHEIAIAPAPITSLSVPPLTSLSSPVLAPSVSISSMVPSVSNTVSVTTTPSYPDLDNFEELLPSTAIARQSEHIQAPIAPATIAPAQIAPAPIAPAPIAPAPIAPAPIAAVPEPVGAQPEPMAELPQLSDGQLLAVSGENFGGPPGSFYLCVGDNGTLTPIDNRPLVLENNQLVPMAIETLPVFAPQPERRDILEAALANSDVFHAETPRDEAPDFRDLNANVSVHCRVSETSTTLNQPIMTPVEVPSKGDSEPAVPSNLEDGLAVIGVTPLTVPTSLELPITVTDPRIAPKTTDPLSSSNYGTTLLPSPNTEMSYITTEEAEVPVVGPISMPLLTDEESVGKSMPILTDDVADRTVSSVESTVGSPSSIDVRESEAEDGGQWTRRLLTPGSDTSETSSEIPLQPVIQLSVNELSRHS